MAFRPACFGLLAFVMGCAGTNTGNPVGDEPKVRRLDDATFRIVDADADACALTRDQDPSKLHPAEADLTAQVGESSAEFIVQMKQGIDAGVYPLPMGSRDEDVEGDPAFVARATEIARTQSCTLEELAEVGGTYVHSFLLINAFVAELTVEQAVAISELNEVASVELAQSNEPPPGL